MLFRSRGRDGSPPFVVRWSDSDHETLVFPGDSTHVVPADETDAGHS